MSSIVTEAGTHTAKKLAASPFENVTNFLLRGKHPGSRALLTLDGDYNYGQIQSAANAIARYLLVRGGRKGDRVLLVADNSFFWVSAYLGTLRAGLVCVPLPPRTSADGLRHFGEITDPRFAFLHSRIVSRDATSFAHIAVVTDASREHATSRQLGFDDLLEEYVGELSGDAGSPHAGGGDLAAIMFTSGSTGKPRGVEISHRNIIANTSSIIECLGLKEDDRMMAVLPFYYCFGASLLHTHLRVGGSLVTDSRFMYPDKVVQHMAETECTGFAGVPSHYQILLRKSSFPRMTFPHLRHMQQAGGHLATVFVRELQAAVPATKIFLMYGQTEATARLSCLPPGSVQSKPGSIGKAIPGVKLRILDSAGRDVAAGCEGEIVAEGENVALGYWRDDSADSPAFRQGMLHTGDIATRDADGFLFLVDRTGDFVKCGGERISCRNIEEQLLEFEDLLEVAVVGIPDEILGEAIQIFAVARDASTTGLEDGLRQFCKQHFSFKLMPKSIVVLKTLPKNSAGKILKATLREWPLPATH